MPSLSNEDVRCTFKPQVLFPNQLKDRVFRDVNGDGRKAAKPMATKEEANQDLSEDSLIIEKKLDAYCDTLALPETDRGMLFNQLFLNAPVPDEYDDNEKAKKSMDNCIGTSLTDGVIQCLLKLRIRDICLRRPQIAVNESDWIRVECNLLSLPLEDMNLISDASAALPRQYTYERTSGVFKISTALSKEEQIKIEHQVYITNLIIVSLHHFTYTQKTIIDCIPCFKRYEVTYSVDNQSQCTFLLLDTDFKKPMGVTDTNHETTADANSHDHNNTIWFEINVPVRATTLEKTSKPSSTPSVIKTLFAKLPLNTIWSFETDSNLDRVDDIRKCLTVEIFRTRHPQHVVRRGVGYLSNAEVDSVGTLAIGVELNWMLPVISKSVATLGFISLHDTKQVQTTENIDMQQNDSDHDNGHDNDHDNGHDNDHDNDHDIEDEKVNIFIIVVDLETQKDKQNESAKENGKEKWIKELKPNEVINNVSKYKNTLDVGDLMAVYCRIKSIRITSRQWLEGKKTRKWTPVIVYHSIPSLRTPPSSSSSLHETRVPISTSAWDEDIIYCDHETICKMIVTSEWLEQLQQHKHTCFVDIHLWDKSSTLATTTTTTVGSSPMRIGMVKIPWRVFCDCIEKPTYCKCLSPFASWSLLLQQVMVNSPLPIVDPQDPGLVIGEMDLCLALGSLSQMQMLSECNWHASLIQNYLRMRVAKLHFQKTQSSRLEDIATADLAKTNSLKHLNHNPDDSNVSLTESIGDLAFMLNCPSTSAVNAVFPKPSVAPIKQTPLPLLQHPKKNVTDDTKIKRDDCKKTHSFQLAIEMQEMQDNLIKGHKFLLIRYRFPTDMTTISTHLVDITSTTTATMKTCDQRQFPIGFVHQHRLQLCEQEDIAQHLMDVHGSIIFELYMTDNQYEQTRQKMLNIGNVVLSVEDLIRTVQCPVDLRLKVNVTHIALAKLCFEPIFLYVSGCHSCDGNHSASMLITNVDSAKSNDTETTETKDYIDNSIEKKDKLIGNEKQTNRDDKYTTSDSHSYPTVHLKLEIHRATGLQVLSDVMLKRYPFLKSLLSKGLTTCVFFHYHPSTTPYNPGLMCFFCIYNIFVVSNSKCPEYCLETQFSDVPLSWTKSLKKEAEEDSLLDGYIQFTLTQQIPLDETSHWKQQQRLPPSLIQSGDDPDHVYLILGLCRVHLRDVMPEKEWVVLRPHELCVDPTLRIAN
ncbi:hypothetical protein RFI_11135, partial [Reticulomyxa filosa]